MDVRLIAAFPSARRAAVWLAGALMATLALPAVAASQRVDGADARQASASVDFRIVIPERIRVTAGASVESRSSREPSRQVERRADRTVITVAQP